MKENCENCEEQTRFYSTSFSYSDYRQKIPWTENLPKTCAESQKNRKFPLILGREKWECHVNMDSRWIVATATFWRLLVQLLIVHKRLPGVNGVEDLERKVRANDMYFAYHVKVHFGIFHNDILSHVFYFSFFFRGVEVEIRVNSFSPIQRWWWNLFVY